MLVFIDNGSQISPCIASKARYALGYKILPKNIKKCTRGYWTRVITTFGVNNNLNEEQVNNAVAMYDQIFNE